MSREVERDETITVEEVRLSMHRFPKSTDDIINQVKIANGFSTKEEATELIVDNFPRLEKDSDAIIANANGIIAEQDIQRHIADKGCIDRYKKQLHDSINRAENYVDSIKNIASNLVPGARIHFDYLIKDDENDSDIIHLNIKAL